MKILQRFLFGIFLFAWGAVPAFAQFGQFSILPYTKLDAKQCVTMLNQFQADLKIPTAEKMAQNDFTIANDEYEKAAKEYDDASKAAESASKDVKSKYGAFSSQHCTDFPDDAGCGAYNDSQKKLTETEQKKTSAEAKKNAAYKEVLGNGVGGHEPDQRSNLLGCAIKYGRITLAMIPYFFTYFINFLLGMSGIITVLFIVIGGYHYVVGGLTEEKEKGKNTIKHALMGMGVALLAWTIVTVLINAITG